MFENTATSAVFNWPLPIPAFGIPAFIKTTLARESAMVIQPKVKGFICTTAHPLGCAANVKEQIRFVQAQGPISNAPKRVLVIGASTGYGLASRITAAFGGGAGTLGIFFEKPASGKRTASAGWYNAAAFQQ